MKTLRLAFLLVVASSAVLAQQKPAVTISISTNRVVETKPATSSATKSTVTTTTSASTGSVAMVATSPGMILDQAKQAAAQGRLQPPSEAALIERYGAGGYLIKKRSLGSALQLINPFAPATYGGVGAPAAAWSWNPQYPAGTAPAPRAFRDDKTHEASGVIFGTSF